VNYAVIEPGHRPGGHFTVRASYVLPRYRSMGRSYGASATIAGFTGRAPSG
jgi:hypothetical protein